MHIAPTTVAARAGTTDHSDLLEHVEVVSKQVGLDPDEPAQLDRRAIGGDQLVDDRQSDWIGQRRIAMGSNLDAPFAHTSTVLLNSS